jgi:spermidine synthase
LALGLLSSLWQMTFLRETLTSFRGNELFLNYFLVVWLVAVGLGCLITDRRLSAKMLSRFVGFFYFVVGALALFFFLAIRLLPQVLNFTAEVANPTRFLFFLPLALLPVCLALGIGFAWGSRYFSACLPGTAALNVNRAYLVETFGFFAGGLAFNFWLIKIPVFTLLTFTIVPGLIIGIFLVGLKKPRLAFLFLGLLLFSTILFFSKGLNKVYEFKTAAWRFPTEKLVKVYNSFFGNIAVTERKGQHNFYEQGALIAPAGDFQTSEELIHIPLLFTPLEGGESSRKILVIGNAWNGFIEEALKYPGLEVFYVEFDLELLGAIYDFLPAETQEELNNPRVKIIKQEAIPYLKSGREKFDFVLLNLAPPSTYQINRYYTREFFEVAKESIKPNGVFAVGLPYHGEALTNPNLNRFLGSIFGAFSKAFPNNALVPAQRLILIGLRNGNSKWEAGDLAERFKTRNPQTLFLSPAYIRYLLTNERTGQILEEIAAASAPLNTNWSPWGVIYWFVAQLELNQPRPASLLNGLFTYRWFIFGFLSLLPVYFVFYVKRRRPAAKLKIVALFASSLALILEIILIFVWQLNIGFIYHQVSLIIGLVMLGIFLANLRLYLKPPADREKSLNFFVGLLFLLAVFLPFLILSFEYQPLWLIKAIILCLALLSGCLAGSIYPLANFLYLEKSPTAGEETGKIYALELLGGGLLLTVFSLFILPFFGLLTAVCFLFYWTLLSFILVRQ